MSSQNRAAARLDQIKNSMGDNSGFSPVERNENESQYTVLDQWHSQPSNVRVIMVGAGAAGILMAYKMQKTMKNYQLQVYEK
jgi:hypothetical protein